MIRVCGEILRCGAPRPGTVSWFYPGCLADELELRLTT
jgi:hypothetical protein